MEVEDVLRVLEEEEEHDYTYASVATCIYLELTALIAITCIFEFCKDWALENASENTRPTVLALFSEMTVLGFIGLVSFLVTKEDVLNDVSESVFGEETFANELLENVHMMLFFVMVLYIAQILNLVRIGQALEQRWRDFHKIVVNYNFDPRDATVHNDNLVRFHALRKQFVEPVKKSDHLQNDFSFSMYLGLNLGECLEDIVELPLWTWIILQAVSSVFFIFMLYCSRIVFICIWIATGWLILGLVLVFRRQLEAISHRLMNPVHIPRERRNTVLGRTLSPFEPNAPPGSINGGGGGANNSNFREIPEDDVSADAESGGKGNGSFEARADHELPHYMRKESLEAHAHAQRERSGTVTERFLGPPPNPHQSLFWFGRSGPAFHLTCIRLTMVLMSVYLSLFCFQFASDIHRHKGGLWCALSIVLALVPVVCVTQMWAEIIATHVITTSVEMMREKRLIKEVIRKQKTQKIVHAMKLLSCMKVVYHSHMASKEDEAGAGAGSYQNPVSPKKKRIIREVDISQLTPQMQHMARTFELFDTDGSGEIDSGELQALMESLGQKIDEDESNHLLAILDADNDGSVSKAEFIAWFSEQESITEDMPIDELGKTIFEMFDDDKSGEITISELNDALKKFGSTLTLDEMADLLREYDEDGDGTINEEEFISLLEKHSHEH